MDIKVLYVHIPNNKGIAAAKQKNNNFTKKAIATKWVTTVLALTLTLKKSYLTQSFNFKSKAVPWEHTYPNIFMFKFEERYIYPLIKNKSTHYLHFINNIFMVWTKSENKLKFFINAINKKHHSRKFDFKFSKEKIEFLDTLVYKDQNTS